MSEQSTVKSCRCMCGATRFEAKLKSADVAVCHCGMCRRWSGGAFLVVEVEGDLDIAAASQSHLGVYRSSDWGERGFCKICGSSLFWRMQDGSFISVSAQCIEGLADAKLGHEIFIDEKPAYYSFAEPTTKLTGVEVIAMFASKAP